ncbi:MAG: hypothetical protein LUC94_01225 [Clostridiales bacterium]|nr:hypothetical protein [Clostridiales bacterium]
MRQITKTVKNTLEEAKDAIHAEREQINYLYPEFAAVMNIITPVILFCFQAALCVVGAVDWIGSTIIQSNALMVQLLFIGYLICPVGWRTEYVEIVAFGYMLYKFFAQRKAEQAED